MFITACCLLALAASDPQGSAPEPRLLDIEVLYLDATRCARSVDTGARLDEALALLRPVMAETGWEARVRRVSVTTEDQARAVRLASSPTLRINGRDIQIESRGTACGDCGKLGKASSVTCREWRFRGEWFASPPKAALVEAILKAMTTAPDPAPRAAGPTSESRASCCESKPSGDSDEGCCQGEAPCDGTQESACTLAAESRGARKQLLKDLMASAVERRETDAGVSLRFKAEPDIVTRLARVVDLERDCCQFLAFRIRIEEKGGPIWLDLTGPASAKKVIREFLDRK